MIRYGEPTIGRNPDGDLIAMITRDAEGPWVSAMEAILKIQAQKKRIAELEGVIKRALIVEENEVSYCAAKMADILREGRRG